MKTRISTNSMAPAERSRHWHETIDKAYFPLDLSFREPDRFSGEITDWHLGGVSLSRLTSQALRYRRLPHHFRAERDEHFLVTVPARTEIFFSCPALSVPSFQIRRSFLSCACGIVPSSLTEAGTMSSTTICCAGMRPVLRTTMW